jgi:hypothetical protein
VAQLLFHNGSQAAKALAKIYRVAVQVNLRHVVGRSEVVAHDR